MPVLVDRFRQSVLRNAMMLLNGDTVQYQQAGESDAVTLTAMPARNNEERETEGSVHRGEHLADFIVFIKDLPGPPARGDSIIWDGRRFLLTHDTAGRLYSFHGQYRSMYRLYTIEVAIDIKPIPIPPEPPVIPPPVDLFGYSPDSVDTYGNHLGTTYSPP